MKYKYKPITHQDGIRLLELQPCEDLSSPLSSRLIHTKISSCNEDIYTHYTALSYVWGSPEMTKRITVDGFSLGITDSLFAALHDLRDQARTLLLWADGVCINQSDELEKTAQIRIMGDIYTSARHTVAYLGPANRNDEERILRSMRPPITSAIPPKEEAKNSLNKRLSLAADARLDKILSRQWFGRVWVFQELVFSTNPWIQCGRTRVRWERFYQALKKEKSEGEKSGQTSISEAPTASIVSQMHEAWEHHHGKRLTSYSAPDNTVLSYYAGESVVFENTLIDLLLARRGLGVTDPKDMVFAHLGFATDGHLWTIGMDYSRTASQLFLDVAWWIQNLYGLPTLFACVGESMATSRLEGLPSWVPDWTHRIPLTLSATRRLFLKAAQGYRNGSPLNIPRKSRAVLQYGDVIGCHLSVNDEVLLTSRELWVRNIPKGICDGFKYHFISAKRLLEKLDEYRHKPQSRLPPDIFQSLDNQWPKVYQAWRYAVQDDEILPPPKTLGEWKSLTSDFFRGKTETVPVYLAYALCDGANAEVVEGKVLARLTSGALALLPASTKPGDLVASLPANFSAYEEPSSFVFRQHPLDGLASEKDELEEKAAQERPIKHVTLIGEGVRDSAASSHYVSEFYQEPEEALLVIR